jgi:hypothetical protein
MFASVIPANAGIQIPLVHAVQMNLERVDVFRPELPERSQPGVNFLEGFSSYMVHSPLTVHARFHKASIAQHSQMLRDRRLRHPKLILDLAHGPLG